MYVVLPVFISFSFIFSFILFAILWNSAFRWIYLSFFLCLLLVFLSHVFVNLPQTTILPYCHCLYWA